MLRQYALSPSGSGKEAGADLMKQRAEAANAEARQAGGEERAFADADDMPKADQADDRGGGDHARVHHHLEIAEIEMRTEGQRQHDALAGLHNEVAGHLQENAERERDNAYGQNEQPLGIRQQMNARGKIHPQIDAEAEQKHRRQLQDIGAGEVRAENELFQNDQQGIEQHGVRPHTERIHGVEHKRQAGDGRGAHVGIGDESHPQSGNAHAQRQHKTADRKGKTIHDDSDAASARSPLLPTYVSETFLSKQAVAVGESMLLFGKSWKK